MKARQRQGQGGSFPRYLASKHGPYEQVRFAADLRTAEAIVEGRRNDERAAA